MRESRNVVVVGGGVIGLATAFELRRRGLEVTVFERGRPGTGATGASGGMLAPISEAEVEQPAELAFGLDSLRRYPEFVGRVERAGGVSCGHRTEGTLWVAVDRDAREQLEHFAGTLRRRELPHRPLTREQVLDLEPHLARRVVSGLFVEHDLQVDPRALARGLVRAIEALGGSVREEVAVEEVRSTARRVTGVVTRDAAGRRETVRCDVCVVCAGAWSDEGLELPTRRVGVRPVKGQSLRMQGPRLLRHVIRTPDFYLVPRDEGELLLGSTVEELGFDESPTAGAALDLLRHAWRLLPGLYDLRLVEHTAGLRPVVEDHMPVIGPTDFEGLYLATGHYRHGILLAAGTAHYLAQAIAGGEDVPELAPFAPARLWSGVAARPAAAGSETDR